MKFTDNFITPIVSLFRTPDANELANRRLAEYKRDLINSEALSAYHAKMVEYYRESITRLSKQVRSGA